MIFKTMVVGPLQCNCVLFACEKTKEAVLIDPGDEAEKILREVEAQGVKVKYLLHTHAHFDHIGATSEIRNRLESPVCLHRLDEQIYNNLPLQGQMFGFNFSSPVPVEHFLEDEEVLSVGEHKIQVIHTPGHSPGGVCFQLQGSKPMLFSGDTLFQQSVGRTDLWGGDSRTLIRSIRERLLVLDDDMPVFPGHGMPTQIGVEKRSNPFL